MRRLPRWARCGDRVGGVAEPSAGDQMNSIPDDAYTEQDADPDTLANPDPLPRLAGTWRGSTRTAATPKVGGAALR